MAWGGAREKNEESESDKGQGFNRKKGSSSARPLTRKKSMRMFMKKKGGNIFYIIAGSGTSGTEGLGKNKEMLLAAFGETLSLGLKRGS